MATEEKKNSDKPQAPKKPKLRFATVHSGENPDIAERGRLPQEDLAGGLDLAFATAQVRDFKIFGEPVYVSRLPVMEEAPPKPKPKALLVVHGMGQQLRFETLDTIVNGLLGQDSGGGSSERDKDALARHVEFGTERLERMEIELCAQSGAPAQKVHIYEAYWSPLTEGVVNLRDVVAFLSRAGMNGLKNWKGVFCHWAFGDMTQRRVPVQTLIYLVLALAVVVSLGIINTAIIAIPAARAPFKDMPKWLTDGLFTDLTHIFNASVIVLAVFGLLIFASMKVNRLSAAWKWLKSLLAGLSLVAFVLSVFAIIATAVAIPILLQRHGNAAPDAVLVPTYVQHLGQGTRWVVIGLAGLAALYVVVRFILSVIRGWFRLRHDEKLQREKDEMLRGDAAPRRDEKPRRLILPTVVILLFVLMVGALIAFSLDLFGDIRAVTDPKAKSGFLQAPVWLALLGVGAFVRKFLVQFVGDVAAYVESHTIDKFDALRTKIKETVWKTARAIYAQKSAHNKFDYDEIIIAGHSLGSVVAYDVLNRLLLDDTAKQGFDVAGRTPLLLTFGSPLDKTAFVFANQGKAKRLTPAREALAAVVQPMIDSQFARAQIMWANVHSHWDIISGALDYYDDPEWNSTPNCPPYVVNVIDPEAVTLLAAHVEYWRNTHIFKILHEALTRPAPVRLRRGRAAHRAE